MTLRIAPEWKDVQHLLNRSLEQLLSNGYGGRVASDWGTCLLMPLIDSHDNPEPVFSIMGMLCPESFSQRLVSENAFDDHPLFSGNYVVALQTGDDYTRVCRIQSGHKQIFWEDLDLDWLRRNRPRIVIMKDST